MKNHGAFRLAFLAAALLACRDDPMGPVTSLLQCEDPQGTLQTCDLIVQEAGALELDILSSECTATGNIVRITKPFQEVVTDDGCSLAVPASFRWDGPFQAGTRIGLAMESPLLPNDPGLIAQGSFPEWTILFEDGGIEEDGEVGDFDDLIMAVRIVP